MKRSAWIVGSGLAGATAAYEFSRNGINTTVFEQSPRWGGLVRSSTLNGVIYEPHGSHIFHTDDREVWDLVNNLIPYWAYEHSVLTVVRNQRLQWPIQTAEISEVYGGRVARELEIKILGARQSEAGHHTLDFESWCRQMMPIEIFEDFVRPYTEKQWGRPAKELSADFAPRRIQLRSDGDKRLFRDQYQGYPDATQGASYELQLRRMLEASEVRLSTPVTLDSLLGEIARLGDAGPDFLVVTAALDEFCGFAYGPLEWRGQRFVKKFRSDVEFAQEAMVVNWPSRDVPWIRTHEAKHASRQDVRGTVIVTEFPGEHQRAYPVPRSDGSGRALNERYVKLVQERVGPDGPRLAIIGRLAEYAYLDQDEVIRHALDGVRQLLGDPKPNSPSGALGPTG